jgi:hypothetical protein
MQAGAQYAGYLKGRDDVENRDGWNPSCPPISLAAPRPWTMKAVDQWREQHDLLRWWRKRHSCKAKTLARELIQAYERATHTCCGCD